MLSAEQIRSFDEQGFLHLPQVIGRHELELVRTAADELIASYDELPAHLQEDFKFGALVGDGIGEGSKLCRIEYTFNQHPRFLMLLANPRVLDIAASLRREPMVITWEDMIIKLPGAGFGVPFHQDALYQSTSTVFSLGIYLDDSSDDPLSVLAGTHRLGPLGEDEVAEAVKERRADAVTVPVKPGDILVHNVRAIHGSPPNDSAHIRRTIYFEFRTPAQVLEESPWDAGWLERRLRLIPEAMRLRGESDLARDDDPALVEELARRMPEWLPPVPDEAPLDLRVHHEDFATVA